MAGPSRIDVRAYDVGFGDCLLVSFGYDAPVGDDRAERHVLIDFGTNKASPNGPSLKEIAGFIESDSHGKLDAVVLSHRHRDHLAGFDPAVGGGTIARLAPDAVVRPWTETPDGTAAAGADSGPRRNLLDVLAAGHAFAANLAAVPFGRRPGDAASELLGLAAMQLGNDAAIAALNDMASRAKAFYLRAGDALSLDNLPGVSITVLGPPDPEQWPGVQKEAASSPEYWLGAGSNDPGALGAAATGVPISVSGDGDATSLLEPGPARWLIDRVDDHLVRSAERLVHQLDSVLNNTSVVLLIEAGGRKLLFPGDAQIENWAYALTASPDHEAICESLRTVDLYKVGHHGSRNATPRQSLYPLLAAAGGAGRTALMSTLPGTYAQTNKVPSDALVAALSASPFSLVRTDALPAGARGVHVAAAAGGPFTVVGDP